MLEAAAALAVELLAAERSRLVASLGEVEDWIILAASHKAGTPFLVSSSSVGDCLLSSWPPHTKVSMPFSLIGYCQVSVQTENWTQLTALLRAGASVDAVGAGAAAQCAGGRPGNTEALVAKKVYTLNVTPTFNLTISFSRVRQPGERGARPATQRAGGQPGARRGACGGNCPRGRPRRLPRQHRRYGTLASPGSDPAASRVARFSHPSIVPTYARTTPFDPIHFLSIVLMAESARAESPGDSPINLAGMLSCFTKILWCACLPQHTHVCSERAYMYNALAEVHQAFHVLCHFHMKSRWLPP